MRVIMGMFFMPRVIVFVGPVITAVIVVVCGSLPGMGVLMLVFMPMIMGMTVFVLMAVLLTVMLMRMLVGMGVFMSVFMGMLMFVLVVTVHKCPPCS